VSKLAPQFGLSDVGLAKLCRRHSIPLPPRGHWAKLSAGRPTTKIPLPPPKGRHDYPIRLEEVSKEKLDQRNHELRQIAELKHKLASDLGDGTIEVPIHPMVRAASKVLLRKSGWKNEKGLRHVPSEVLDISVTEGSVERALDLTNRVFHALGLQESFGVKIDAEKQRTYLEFKNHGVRFQFQITEQVRRSNHELTEAEKLAQKRYYESFSSSRFNANYTYPPRYDYHPTGLLTLSIGDYPYRKTWNDTKSTELLDRIEEIVVSVITGIESTKKYLHEQELERQRRERARLRYEDLKKRRTEELAKLEDAERQAQNLERAERLRKLADAKEAQAIAQGQLTPKLIDWLCWVRAKADTIDPTVLVSDPILDAPFKEGQYGYGW
jgi:hypothetical protein